MARLEPGKFCPLIKKDCIELQCSWYTQVRGRHPQTGNEVDEWACAVAWIPVLQINTSQEVRQGAAATESLRNQVVGSLVPALNLQTAAAVAMQVRPALPPGAGTAEPEGGDQG
jgi:hypothetical protein